jgi:hypothetical protein
MFGFISRFFGAFGRLVAAANALADDMEAARRHLRAGAVPDADLEPAAPPALPAPPTDTSLGEQAADRVAAALAGPGGNGRKGKARV